MKRSFPYCKGRFSYRSGQQRSRRKYDDLIHGINLVPMKAEQAGSSLFRPVYFADPDHLPEIYFSIIN
ncbi:hypothetical protein [Maridesulfovibrio sp.]|uniref:hypothetical protein n=1 Tax=Maridesulfovibrio sp. TaxID=2795000 RepID=UPI0039EE0E99